MSVCLSSSSIPRFTEKIGILQRHPFSRFAFTARFISIFVSVTSFLALRWIDPTKLGAALPLHPSCGALTGLPCLFCGMTRALHFLLNGDFNHALYFNWLAFPFVAIVTFIVALFSVELAAGRVLLELRSFLYPSTKRVAILAAVTAVLWILQVCLAVSQHKTELLNPRACLYSVFVN